MTSDRIAGKVFGDGAEVFSDAIGKTTASLTNIQFITVGTHDRIVYIARGAGEVRSPGEKLYQTYP